MIPLLRMFKYRHNKYLRIRLVYRMEISRNSISYDLCEQQLELLPEKAVFWHNQSTLILADLHLGKISHFRKAGIAVPMDAAEDGLIRLESLLNSFDLTRVLILGDLFHSEMNREWEDFVDLLYRNSDIEFHLVIGNHDILGLHNYERIPLVTHEEVLELGPFIFSHDALNSHKLYNIHGHIHPAIRLQGKARQSLRLACYFFSKTQAILPAFGTFTGKHTLQYTVADNVFIIAGDKVIKID